MSSLCRHFATGALALLAFAASVFAQSEAPKTPPYQEDLRAVRSKVTPKLSAGQHGREAYAAELQELDRLLEKYRGDREAESGLMVQLGMLLNIAVQDEEAGRRLFERVIKEYPDSQAAQAAKRQLSLLTPEAKAQRDAQLADRQAKVKADEEVRAAMLGKAAPPISFQWSSVKGWSSLDDLRGKVVVLDFWATWCGPCIASFPKIRAKVAHYANSPVVVLGVTSLQGRISNLESKPIDVKDQPEKEYALTAEFMKKHDMTWPVVFSTENVFNPAYAVRGIPNVTIIAPDGTVRATGLHPALHEEAIGAHITALLKEFGLPLPPAI